ncbi:MAG: hypothetical protein NC181_00455 [Clostridium sp.]|nr:hypothetical protein [Clostridium sp.]MCM1443864.1 hypothetical protein [Candidatus Amulumruptor caecigallinarius]
MVRKLLAGLDKIIVWLIETLYSLLNDISRVKIFENDAIKDFAGRIAVILGIFMLFKLSFSFLTYIINPEQLTDKSKGFGKLIQNIVVALVLLTSYQFLFSKAMDLQLAILDNNTIPQLIFGNNKEAVANQSDGGKIMAFYAFSAFLPTNSNLGNCNYALDDFVCKEILNDEYKDGVVTGTYPGINTSGEKAGDQLEKIVEQKNAYALLDLMVPVRNGNVFAFDYRLIISTACGVIIALVLLSFSFDIAVRSIKLSFLELIAPIPIIGYIDPNKGEGMFKKYLGSVGKTYVDLFIRLVAIYFAIYIIMLIGDGNIKLSDGSSPNLMIIVFIIIGALMFAKQLPKLIQEITGLNLDGKMQLNPFKKISENALGGKALVSGAAALGAAGLAAGSNFVHRTAAGINNAKNSGKISDAFKGIGKGVGSGIAGGFSAGRRAFSHGMKGEGFGKSLWMGEQEAMFAKLQREDYQRQGSTLGGRVQADMARYAGVLNRGQLETLRASQMDNAIKASDERVKYMKSQLTNLKQGKLEPLTDLQTTTKAIDGLLENDGRVKGAKAAWDAAKATGDPVRAEQARLEYKYTKGKVMQEMTTDPNSHMSQLVQQANTKIEKIGNPNIKKIDTKVTEAYSKTTGGDYTKTADGKYVKVEHGKGNYVEQQVSQYSSSGSGSKDYVVGSDGKMVKVAPGTGKYSKQVITQYTEVTGGNYDKDSSGNYVRVKDGTGKYSINATSGVTAMGAIDDQILLEKTMFESSEEYTTLNGNITFEERFKEAISTDNTTTYTAMAMMELQNEESTGKRDRSIPISAEFQKAYKEYEEARRENDSDKVEEAMSKMIEEANKIVSKDKYGEFNYSVTHDQNSSAKIDNASRGVKAPQSEGWKPNPYRADPRNYMGYDRNHNGPWNPNGPGNQGGPGTPGGPGNGGPFWP